MGNPKSDWGFSATSLGLAMKGDQLALRICAVDGCRPSLTSFFGERAGAASQGQGSSG